MSNTFGKREAARKVVSDLTEWKSQWGATCKNVSQGEERQFATLRAGEAQDLQEGLTAGLAQGCRPRVHPVTIPSHGLQALLTSQSFQ